MRLIENLHSGKIAMQWPHSVDGVTRYLPVNNLHRVLLSPDEIVGYMCVGHAECADFTDTGETDQPERGTKWDKTESDAEILAFWQANTAAIGQAIITAMQSGSEWHTTVSDCARSIGADFWYTRNGHGVGFWDRVDVWGQGSADLLSEASRKSGARCLYLGDDNLTYYGQG